MPTTMIRVEQGTHKKLRALASRTGDTMPRRVAAAVEEFERRLFWEQVNDEFATLRDDPKLWKHELEERAAWDAAFSDGMED